MICAKIRVMRRRLRPVPSVQNGSKLMIHRTEDSVATTNFLFHGDVNLSTPHLEELERWMQKSLLLIRVL